MRTWGEFVGFLRGTRPRPPPGRKRPLASVLLFAAAIAHLPIVYLLVREIVLQPAFTLSVGLLSMGLAWSGGVALEGRRRGTAQLLAACALGESALAFVPAIADPLGSARWLFVLVGALAVGALAALLQDP